MNWGVEAHVEASTRPATAIAPREYPSGSAGGVHVHLRLVRRRWARPCEVACGGVAAAGPGLEHRIVAVADRLRQLAAGMEAAAGGQIDRTGRVALDRDRG